MKIKKNISIKNWERGALAPLTTLEITPVHCNIPCSSYKII